MGRLGYGELEAGAETAAAQAFHPQGTVSSPGLSFSGDANTGWYLQGEDTIGHVVGGVEQFRVSSAAFVFQLSTAISSSGTLTITAPTITTPTIASTGWASANHTHAGGTTGGTIASAALAATVTVIDSTDTSAFVALFDSATGSLAVKTDGGLTYNAGTGMLTATGFTGPLTGTLQTAAQTNITSVGVLNVGSINTGFGNINNGSSTITTTGTISGGAFTATGALTAGAASTITLDADSEFIALKLTNQSDAASTAGYVSLAFDLEDTGGTAVDAGKISVIKEASFTATASTQDSKMEFQLSENGTLAEKMTLSSAGNLSIDGSLTLGGALSVGNGGTGATSLTNLITLGTHTAGNYAATVADLGAGGILVAGSGSESAAITVQLNVHGLTTDTLATGDFIAFSDEDEANDVPNKLTVDNLMKTGIPLVTEDTVAVATDYMLFLDGGATGNTNKESIADFVSGIAGTNLTAASGQLSAPGGAVPNPFLFA